MQVMMKWMMMMKILMKCNDDDDDNDTDDIGACRPSGRGAAAASGRRGTA